MSSDGEEKRPRGRSKPERPLSRSDHKKNSATPPPGRSTPDTTRSRSTGRKKEKALKEATKLESASKEKSKDSGTSGRRSRSKSREGHSRLEKSGKEGKDSSGSDSKKSTRRARAAASEELVPGVEFVTEREFRKSGVSALLGGEGGFTHVLCIVAEPRSEVREGMKDISNASHVPLGTQSQFLTQLPLCHQQLVLGKSSGKAVVVYDQRNVGLAAALAVTFRISLLEETAKEAEERMNSALADVRLSDKEREEVLLWEGMGGMIDMKDPKWMQFMANRRIGQEQVLKAMLTQSSKASQQNGATPLARRLSVDGRKGKLIYSRAATEANATSAQERASHHLQSWRNAELQVAKLNSPGAGAAGYYCGKCKKRLFTAENILADSMQRENERTQFFLEPMRWMGDLSGASGDIECYNCAALLGAWKWGAVKCAATKERFNPGFYVKKATVTLEQLQRTAPPSSPSTSKKGRRSMLMGKLGFGKDQEEAAKSNSKDSDDPIVATAFEELPKDMQKSLAKAKITAEMANENWRVTCLVLRFVHKKTVCSQGKAERIIAVRAARKAREEAKSLEAKEEEEAEAAEGSEEGVDVRDDAEKVEEEQSGAKDLGINVEDFGFLVKACPFESYAYRTRSFIETATEALIAKGDCSSKYKIQEQLGSGGFGRVYLAKGPKGEKFAVKKMPHETDKQRRINLREICMLHHCKHDNIVQYFETYIVKKEMWVVMEYMEGGTLQEANARHNFSEIQIAYIAKFSLKALDYLHENGLVHRDLKPINIMLTVNAIVKIIDFGLAEETIALVKNPRLVGSAFWMPPEVIRGEPHGPPADIWSLGMTLLQLANNERQYKSSAMRALFVTATRGYPNPFKHPNEWSAPFRDFTSKLLEFDQNLRPSAAQLLEHEFLGKATSRKRMEKVLSNIFLQGIEETFFL